MKESRYIELLNLYIDHRLTPAEAAELEAEVQSNPRRRKIYSQYCRIQKACALIFDAERSLAPKTAAVLTSFDADNRVAPPALFWRWALVPAVGLAAAIALVAVVGLRWYANSEVLAPGSGTNAGLALAGGDVKESPATRTIAGGQEQPRRFRWLARLRLKALSSCLSLSPTTECRPHPVPPSSHFS